MTDAVVDTSAVLAWIWGEPGAEQVDAAIEASHLSTVNLAELAQKLSERAMDDAGVARAIAAIPCKPHAFDEKDAIAAGLLRRQTRTRGLSLGDRACLALGLRLNLPVYTADRAWAELDLGVEVVLIRGP